MKYLTPSAALVALALLLFFGVYEKFPRVGWVDPSIYSGYILNLGLYFIYDVGSVVYQGSRISFILPAHVLGEIFGPQAGRAVFALGLYLAYLGTMMALSVFLLRNMRLRAPAVLFFLLHPLAMAAIFYGGADGPALVYMLLSIVGLMLTMRSTRPLWRDLLAVTSGALAIMSVGAHILMVFPFLLIFPALFVMHGHTRPLLRDGLIAGAGLLLMILLSQYILLTILILFLVPCALFLFGTRGFVGFFMLGAITTMGAMTAIAAQLGLSSYIWSNVPWTHASIMGTGVQFIPPFDFWLKQGVLWLPTLLLAVLSLIVRVPRGDASRRLKLLTCRLNLCVPLVCYVAYDRLLGGNLLGTPAYFNLLFPSFIVGFFLLLSLVSEAPNESLRLQRAIGAIAVLALVLGFHAPYTDALYKYNDVQSGHFYDSQTSFVKHIVNERREEEPIQFIYDAAESPAPPNPRIYSDYFRGKPRYFDYIDSMVGSFLWSSSTRLRIDRAKKFVPWKVKLERRKPIILLARSEKDLTALRGLLSGPLSRAGLRAGKTVCHSENKEYPWCYIYYRR